MDASVSAIVDVELLGSPVSDEVTTVVGGILFVKLCLSAADAVALGNGNSGPVSVSQAMLFPQKRVDSSCRRCFEGRSGSSPAEFQ